MTIDTPMRPEFERGAGTGQWHGGPIAAEIDTVGDYAAALVLGRTLPTVIFRVHEEAAPIEPKEKPAKTCHSCSALEEMVIKSRSLRDCGLHFSARSRQRHYFGGCKSP
jgi:hypothetical protein